MQQLTRFLLTERVARSVRVLYAVVGQDKGFVSRANPSNHPWGPIYKFSYDLSYDYRKFIVRSTYDSDLKSAKISFRNIVSYFANTVSDDLTALQVNRT